MHLQAGLLFAKSYHILIILKELKVLNKAASSKPQAWDPMGLPFLPCLLSWLLSPLRRRAGEQCPLIGSGSFLKGRAAGEQVELWLQVLWWVERDWLVWASYIWVPPKFPKWALPSLWLLSLELCVLLPTVAVSSIWCSSFYSLKLIKI